MSMYAHVNEDICPVLAVTEPDETIHEDEPIIEDVENPIYEEDSVAYPPHPRFLFSYDCYLKHTSCTWTVNENNPADDYDKFAKAPKDFQRIMLATAGVIMIGDSVVLDKLHMNVTPINVKMMFTNQIDRENTHQLVYSKWLDISLDGPYYRTAEFRRDYMGCFEELAEKYRSSDIRLTMYFIMICENIMFAPMFQTICYCATKGYAPKLCNSNLLAMRDEYLHYVHTRGLSASFKKKIKLSLARQILFEMYDMTLRVYRKIIGTYDDGVFNFQHVSDHFEHVKHSFMTENQLYLDRSERMRMEERCRKIPMASYMSLPKSEIKINLMESSSTIYDIDGLAKEIDMTF